MTLDEDAAKVVVAIRESLIVESKRLAREYPSQIITNEWYDNMMATHIAAFGRRCAEQMREECAKACRDLADTFERNSKAMDTEHKVIMSHVIEGTIHSRSKDN